MTLTRYRRIPEPCRAAQWWPGLAGVPGVIPYAFPDGTASAVRTVLGYHRMEPGEWVVTFGDGHWTVFSDSYFRANFEAASEA